MRTARLFAVLMLMTTPALAQTTTFARPELLVDTQWLARNLGAPNVRIVDLRPRGYGEGHVPGAVWLDNNDLRNPKAPPTFLPTAQAFAALMGRLGIAKDREGRGELIGLQQLSVPRHRTDPDLAGLDADHCLK